MQPTDHSSNKNIIEKETFFFFFYFHTVDRIKAIEFLRHPILRPYRLFHGELSHQYGNANLKFILFPQWEKVSLVVLRLYEVCRNLLAESKTGVILHMFQG